MTFSPTLHYAIRVYLAIVALRHLGTAIVLFRDSDRFITGPSHQVLIEVASPMAWGVMMLVIGLMAAMTALLKNQIVLARIVTILSVTVSLSWAASFGIVLFEEPSASVLLFIVFLSLSLKDLVISSLNYFDVDKELVDQLP